jgi:hypothetical protein
MPATAETVASPRTRSFNAPVGLCLDNSGNLFIADTFNDVIREVVAATGLVQTVAGNGTTGYAGDGGAPTSAQLNLPTAVLVDSSGNLFISDSANNVIREVSAGTIQTVAGTGTAGFSGDGGLATSAQLRTPTGLALDASSNLWFADNGNNVIREVLAQTHIINTVVGQVAGGYGGDNGPAANALLLGPTGLFLDASGNLFIADTGNNVIREVAGGIIQTVAGNGTQGYTGDGGAATSATMDTPVSVFTDASGNLYIADAFNYVVRKVTSGTIRTFAGNSTKNLSGDGALATNAFVDGPWGVVADSSGDLYLTAFDADEVRKVSAGTGLIQTVAGNGTSGFSGDGGAATAAQLYAPTGLALDPSGNLFIADQGNHRIREVLASNGNIQTIAGSGGIGYTGDGGPATSAQIGYPTAIFRDSHGNIFFGDWYNNVVREVLASNGNILTVAGTGTAGYTGDGGPATLASLNVPCHVGIDPAGNFLIADLVNNRVRRVGALAILQVPVANLSVTSLDFGNQLVSVPSNTQTVTLTNNSTQPLNITSIALTGANASDFLESDNCGTGLAAGLSCTIILNFRPLAIAARTASLTLTDGASNSPQSISLTGTGTPITSMTTASSSLNPSTFGQAVTFTASIGGLFPTVIVGQPASRSRSPVPLGAVLGGPPVPTGTVTFRDGSTQLGTANLDASGQATYSTAALAVGTHPITASYSGDTAYAASTSSLVSQVVNAAPDYTLTSPGPVQTVASGGTATYSIVVTPTAQGGGSFTGTVTFTATGMPSGSVTTFNPTSVVPGSSAAPTTLTIRTPVKAALLALPGARLLPRRVWPLLFLALALALLALAQPRANSLTPARMSAPRFVLLLLFLAGVVMGAAACNGGFGAPAPASVSYTLTVTATSGSVVHTTNLSLTVQ